MIEAEGFEAFLQSEMRIPKKLNYLVQEESGFLIGHNVRNSGTQNADKPAVLMPNWLSEFILALSVVTRKAGDSDQEITLIVPEHLVRLCKLLSILPVLPYNRKNSLNFLDSAALVKETSFGKLYLLPHSFSSAWFGFKTGILNCRGVGAEQRNQFLSECISPEIINKKEHLTKEYSIVLETSYVEPSLWPGITIDPNPQAQGTVVLCPGANEPSHIWAGFEELVKLWVDQHFVIIGEKEDIEKNKSIGQRLPHRVTNLTGKTTFEETAAIMAGASVVIANDSGPLQLAGYLGVPTVGIFGSTTPQWRRPLGDAVRAVTSSDALCQYCFKRDCAKKDHLCMSTILPEHVMCAAMEIMRT